MRLEVFLPILLAFPIGLLFFISLIRRVDAHLRSWKEKLFFFFWPFPPYRMLIVQELDGEINIYYDDDFEEIQSENKTMIKTIDGQQYVTEIPPSESSVTVSMFDAKAPAGYYSPFAIGWRWIVAASILVYFMYYALVVAWLPPIEIEKLELVGKTIEVARPGQLNPWEALVATTTFFTTLTWFTSNIMRMNDRTIQYAWYHAKGINPPNVAIVPVPGLSNVPLLEYLEKLGREITIVVPGEAAETIRKAMEEVEKKTGSRSLAATILAKLAIARTWRQALAQTLRERFDLRKAGEAAAMIRMGLQPVTKKMIPVILVVAVLAFAMGYFLGNVFSIGVAPANTTTPTPAAPVTQAPSAPSAPPAQPAPATPPAQPNATVTPAPMPPPPGG